MDGRFTVDDLLAKESLAEHGPIIAELAAIGQRRGNHEPTLNGAMDALIARRHRKELNQFKSQGLTDEVLRAIHSHHSQPDPRRMPRIS